MSAFSLLARAVLWFLAMSLSLAGASMAADPFARATVATKGTIYAGQQVEVDVDVLVPNYFLSPPQFPLFDIPGAVVTMPDDRGMNLNETVNGEDFSGIRKTYVIVPQEAGDYPLPAAEIPFGYAAVPGQMSQGKVTIPPLTITVAAVPAGTGGAPGVTAGELTITQTFDRDLSGLHVGDALVRTLTIRATGLAPMMIPVPAFKAPEDVQVYLHDPALSEERTARGDITAGLRKDTATYVFAKAGTVSLPAIALQWFNPASGKMETAEAEGAKITIVAAPAADTALAPPAQPAEEKPFDWLWWVSAAGTILALALLLQAAANLFGRLESWLTATLARRAQSEATSFRRVINACRDHDGQRLEAALDGWSRKTGNVPLSKWLGAFADPDTNAAFARHRQSCYGARHSHSEHPDHARLGAGLKAARRRWQEKTARDRNGPTGELPPLNLGLEAGIRESS